MERLVHIVPLGWERSRASGPILDAKAHRIYLLVRTDHDRTTRFIEAVKEDIKPIVGSSEVNVVGLDNVREFDSVLMHVSRLVVQENDAGNRVYLNMSASGKVAAAATTLAGMYHADRLGGLYYAKSKKYATDFENPGVIFAEEGLSVGYDGTLDIPRFRVQKPRPSAIHALAALYAAGPMTLVDLIDALGTRGIDPFTEADIKVKRDDVGKFEHQKNINKWAARLRRTVLSELLATELVEQSERGMEGKVRVSLTRHGEYHALISGFISELNP